MQSPNAEQAVAQQPAVIGRLEGMVRGVNPVRMLAILAQLVLIIGLAKVFNLETPALINVMLLVTVGFVIHHVLPMTMRLPFFVVLSFAALILVVGPWNAARLALVGLALIGLCHLPVHFNIRLGLIAVAGAALVLGRADQWFILPGYEAIWPILGSMFMFRLIIYVYDLKHCSAPFSVSRSLAYFFMLPNVCYPMYPVVDYHQFNRHYFDEPSPWRTYQVGIKWIFRGFLHLLLYRAISNYALIDASFVDSAGDLARYMVATYGLYLMISGMFHVVVGVLRLFGFNLPETHHLYFLSASFTDFWRRINIYWKDFILKIFFNPVYFRVKKVGASAAMIIATIVSFFFTWLLHSYQWFWIRGEFPLIWQDALFWGILALLVLVNVLYEQKYGRTRRLKGQRWPISARVIIGLQTIGTFCVITTLWCLWTFQGSFSEWLTFMGNITNMTVASALWIAGGLLALGGTSAVFAHVGREHSAGTKLRKPQGLKEDTFPFWRSVSMTLAGVVAILIFVQLTSGLPMLKRFRLIEVPYRDTLQLVVTDLRQALTEEDRQQQDRGYYEDLTNTRNYNLELWELYHHQPVGLERLEDTEAARVVPDQFHQLELVPSKSVEFRGANMTTNQWGMRDRPYDKPKPPDIFRAAVIGTCTTMGWGVDDHQSYENIVEDRLNQQLAGDAFERFELLNFGIGGFSAPQQMWSFERSLEFDPDVVIWEVHTTVLEWVVNHMADVIAADIDIPYPGLRERIEKTGLTSQSSSLQVKATLHDMAPELMKWVWQWVQQRCDERGIEFRLLIIPRANARQHDHEATATHLELAREAGVDVLDISDAYEPAPDQSKLRLAAWDSHPNVEGHRLLADGLYRELVQMPIVDEGRDPGPTDVDS